MSPRPRYYFRTVRPHVWAIMRRDDSNLDPAIRPDSERDEVLEWIGARQHHGDRGAREYARVEVERLNA